MATLSLNLSHVSVDGVQFPLIQNVTVVKDIDGVHVEAHFKEEVPATMAAVEYERLCAAMGVPSTLRKIGRE